MCFKATGVALAKVARPSDGRQILDGTGSDARVKSSPALPDERSGTAVYKFPCVDTIWGPEVRSIGKVMGVWRTFAKAFSKVMLGSQLRKSGHALLSVREATKPGGRFPNC
ncbi:MAG: Carbamoyl-phosphate synthase large chain [Sodalis sp.]|nr:MAG: Carbamoyl-phosphate synthase large chain [Sodalis sp.]